MITDRFELTNEQWAVINEIDDMLQEAQIGIFDYDGTLTVYNKASGDLITHYDWDYEDDSQPAEESKIPVCMIGNCWFEPQSCSLDEFIVKEDYE